MVNWRFVRVRPKSSAIAQSFVILRRRRRRRLRVAAPVNRFGLGFQGESRDVGDT